MMRPSRSAAPRLEQMMRPFAVSSVTIRTNDATLFRGQQRRLNKMMALRDQQCHRIEQTKRPFSFNSVTIRTNDAASVTIRTNDAATLRSAVTIRINDATLRGQ
ncbi:hypothetical protein AVEN_18084-1 [Araneus ventricosus]|uniref:Uncharacterized protein n=1 Tax=Araneus ventricosus TaxID=182803 RepID=A0A4Y2R2G6_ARAVE|nr:hypothetical protein AVEN_18084-1 [Araneus ventricosus]